MGMLFASRAFNNNNKRKTGVPAPTQENTTAHASDWLAAGESLIGAAAAERLVESERQLNEVEKLQLRNQRIQELYPLVKAVARRVVRAYPKADVEELVSDGCVGLIRAVDLFDPTRGVALEAYARRLIIGAIFNGMRKRDPLTSRVRRALRETEEERYRIAATRGTMPTMAEMEQRDKRLSGVRQKALQRSVVSLDAPLPTGMTVSPSTEKDPETAAVERTLLGTALVAMNTLPSKHREVMMLYYMGHKSLPAIALKMGVTRQRVSQIHREALKAIADYMNANRES